MAEGRADSAAMAMTAGDGDSSVGAGAPCAMGQTGRGIDVACGRRAVVGRLGACVV